MVDETTFSEYRNLILPDVEDPSQTASLALGFPSCRPLREGDPEPIAASRPAATQPLRIVLAQVGVDSQSNAPDRTPDLQWQARRRQTNIPIPPKPLSLCRTTSQPAHFDYQAPIIRRANNRALHS